MLRKRVFALIIPILISIVGCSPNQVTSVPKPHVTIKPLHAHLRLPSKGSIKSIKIIDDASGTFMVPNNERVVLNEVFSMVNTKTISVQLPKLSPKYHWSVAAYTGPSVLLLYPQPHNPVKIAPAFYIWVDAGGNPSYRYLHNIVSYTYGGYKVYLRDPKLYQWLKNDTWKSQFKPE